MVRLPCWIATVETRTFSPMTITPATSSITTLAGESGSTVRFSTWEMKAIMLWPGGGRMATMVGLSAVAEPGKAVLITWAIRPAVVKSGLRKVNLRVCRLASWKPNSFSMIAPPAMRPAVGTPLEIEDPEAPEALTEPVCTVP